MYMCMSYAHFRLKYRICTMHHVTLYGTNIYHMRHCVQIYICTQYIYLYTMPHDIYIYISVFVHNASCDIQISHEALYRSHVQCLM